MKKILLLMVMSVLGLQQTFAQASKLTQAELKFRNQIEQFLKEEGFVPTIDNDDNSLNWKKEGDNYWLTVSGSLPTYVQINKSGFTLKDSNRLLLLEACNDNNLNKRCGKATATDTSVLITVEFYCYDIESFRVSFYDNIRALDSAKKHVKDYYNEHDK